MNIKDTVYEDTIGIEFSPDDFHAMNLSPRAVIDSSGGTCVLVPTETAIALRDRLNEFFPPEAAGSHGYPLVPTVHPQPCGGQIPQRATAVRNERYTGRAGTIPKHDRRNAHRGKIKEGETE